MSIIKQVLRNIIKFCNLLYIQTCVLFDNLKKISYVLALFKIYYIFISKNIMIIL